MAPQKKNLAAATAGKRGRPAKSCPPPAAKKARREEKKEKPKKNLTPMYLELVKNALKGAVEQLPSVDARELLLGSVELALKGEHEERHEYQNEIAQMIGQVFVGVRNGLEADVEEKKHFVEEADQTKAQLEQGQANTSQNMEAKQQEISEKKANKASDASVVKELSAALGKVKNAEQEQESLKSTLLNEQTKFSAVFEENFKRLRDAPPAAKKDGEKLLKGLMALLAKMKADDSMSRGLPLAILKAPETRGDFDLMAITAAERLFAKAAAEWEEKIQSQALQLQSAQEATAHAQQALKAAEQKLLESAECLGSAESERKEIEKMLKVAMVDLKKHEKSVEETNAALETSEKKLQDFAKVEEAFLFLKDFTKKPKAPLEEEAVATEEEELVEEEEELEAENQVEVPCVPCQ